jgi:hypothetical protein
VSRAGFLSWSYLGLTDLKVWWFAEFKTSLPIVC